MNSNKTFANQQDVWFFLDCFLPQFFTISPCILHKCLTPVLLGSIRLHNTKCWRNSADQPTSVEESARRCVGSLPKMSHVHFLRRCCLAAELPQHLVFCSGFRYLQFLVSLLSDCLVYLGIIYLWAFRVYAFGKMETLQVIYICALLKVYTN